MKKIQENNFMHLIFKDNCAFVKLKFFLPVIRFIKQALKLKNRFWKFMFTQ